MNKIIENIESGIANGKKKAVNSIVDYSNPKEWGRKSFHMGVDKIDCPIDGRTHANAKNRWISGWDEESRICKGLYCQAVDGAGHSKSCMEEHDRAINGL